MSHCSYHIKYIILLRISLYSDSVGISKILLKLSDTPRGVIISQRAARHTQNDQITNARARGRAAWGPCSVERWPFAVAVGLYRIVFTVLL